VDIGTAITLMLTLVDNLGRMSAVIAAARAEGRTHLSPDEWAVILADADAARAALGVPPAIPSSGLGGALGSPQGDRGANLPLPDGT
jgi:hypothetical protein